MNTSYDSADQKMMLALEEFSYNEINLSSSSDISNTSHAGPKAETTTDSEKALRISQEEISRLVAEAHTQGLATGERQAADHFKEELGRERQRFVDLIVQFEQQRSDYYSKVEVELVHLALGIAAKILHRESQVDRMVVAGLVKVMLERLQNNTKIIVRVRPEDAESWRHYFRDHENLQVIEDSVVEPKGCLLETELGVADMGLDSQLKEVEKGFFDLLAQRPEPK